MEVHMLRQKDELGNNPRWTIFDAHRVMKGQPRGTKKSLIADWSEEFGRVTSILTIRGLHRPSEAAMTISSIRRQLQKQAAG